MDLLVVFLIGLFTSSLGSLITGSIGLLTLPLLMVTGLSPLAALGVHRLGVTGFQISSFYKLHQNGKVNWSLVLPFIIIGVPAALLGSLLVLSIDESILERVIGFVILLFIPITIFKPDLGVVSHHTSVLKKRLGYLAYLFSSIYGSSLLVGVGVFNTYIQTYFFGQTMLQAKATVKIPGLIKNVAVLIIFALSNLIDWQLGFVLMAGMLIGGYFGTHYAIKIGDKWLRNILLITITLFSIKLILGL